MTTSSRILTIVLVAGAVIIAYWFSMSTAGDHPAGTLAPASPRRTVPPAEERRRARRHSVAAGGRAALGMQGTGGRTSGVAPSAVAEDAERVLMAELRSLSLEDAERVVELAREGNERFPNGPDAAERAWFVAKSLDHLGRFHEARDEAETMVRRYPGTRWAMDAERHLLVYPLDQPSREQVQERMAREAEN